MRRLKNRIGSLALAILLGVSSVPMDSLAVEGITETGSLADTVDISILANKSKIEYGSAMWFKLRKGVQIESLPFVEDIPVPLDAIEGIEVQEDMQESSMEERMEALPPEVSEKPTMTVSGNEVKSTVSGNALTKGKTVDADEEKPEGEIVSKSDAEEAGEEIVLDDEFEAVAYNVESAQQVDESNSSSDLGSGANPEPDEEEHHYEYYVFSDESVVTYSKTTGVVKLKNSVGTGKVRIVRTEDGTYAGSLEFEIVLNNKDDAGIKIEDYYGEVFERGLATQKEITITAPDEWKVCKAKDAKWYQEVVIDNEGTEGETTEVRFINSRVPDISDTNYEKIWKDSVKFDASNLFSNEGECTIKLFFRKNDGSIEYFERSFRMEYSYPPKIAKVTIQYGEREQDIFGKSITDPDHFTLVQSAEKDCNIVIEAIGGQFRAGEGEIVLNQLVKLDDGSEKLVECELTEGDNWSLEKTYDSETQTMRFTYKFKSLADGVYKFYPEVTDEFGLRTSSGDHNPTYHMAKLVIDTKDPTYTAWSVKDIACPDDIKEDKSTEVWYKGEPIVIDVDDLTFDFDNIYENVKITVDNERQTLDHENLYVVDSGKVPGKKLIVFKGADREAGEGGIYLWLKDGVGHEKSYEITGDTKAPEVTTFEISNGIGHQKNASVLIRIDDKNLDEEKVKIYVTDKSGENIGDFKIDKIAHKDKNITTYKGTITINDDVEFYETCILNVYATDFKGNILDPEQNPEKATKKISFDTRHKEVKFLELENARTENDTVAYYSSNYDSDVEVKVLFTNYSYEPRKDNDYTLKCYKIGDKNGETEFNRMTSQKDDTNWIGSYTISGDGVYRLQVTYKDPTKVTDGEIQSDSIMSKYIVIDSQAPKFTYFIKDYKNFVSGENGQRAKYYFRGETVVTVQVEDLYFDTESAVALVRNLDENEEFTEHGFDGKWVHPQDEKGNEDKKIWINTITLNTAGTYNVLVKGTDKSENDTIVRYFMGGDSKHDKECKEEYGSEGPALSELYTMPLVVDKDIMRAKIAFVDPGQEVDLSALDFTKQKPLYSQTAKDAVICIKEKNFDASLVEILIDDSNKDHEKNYELGPWTILTDGKGAEWHCAVLKPNSEITDYTISVDGKDLAEREMAEKYVSRHVVIDNDPPIIKFAYPEKEGNECINQDDDTRSYKAATDVEVIITDHSFDEKATEIFIVTGDNENVTYRTYKIPEGDQWISNGDIHTLIVHDVPETRYYVHVLSKDLALNEKNGSENNSAWIVVDDIPPVLEYEIQEAENIKGDKFYYTGESSITKKPDGTLEETHAPVPLTLTVIEDNFDLNDSSLKIILEKVDPSGKNKPSKEIFNGSGWALNNNAGTISFTDDGHYRLKLTYSDYSNNGIVLKNPNCKLFEEVKDKAGNVTSIVSKTIVIDNTNPKCFVEFAKPEYSDKDALYFRGNNIVNFRFEEDNFNKKQVRITMTREGESLVTTWDGTNWLANGLELSEAQLLSEEAFEWDGESKVRVKLNQDATYSFKVEYVDWAGHSVEVYEQAYGEGGLPDAYVPYSHRAFITDNTRPKCTINLNAELQSKFEDEDKSEDEADYISYFYKNDFAPTVRVVEKHFDKEHSKIVVVNALTDEVIESYSGEDWTKVTGEIDTYELMLLDLTHGHYYIQVWVNDYALNTFDCETIQKVTDHASTTTLDKVEDVNGQGDEPGYTSAKIVVDTILPKVTVFMPKPPKSEDSEETQKGNSENKTEIFCNYKTGNIVIHVEEDNFDERIPQYKLTLKRAGNNSDEKVEESEETKWEEVKDTKGKTIAYEMTIPVDVDGDYNVELTYIDRSNNKAKFIEKNVQKTRTLADGTYSSKTIIIDTVAPTAEFVIEEQNKHYYEEDREGSKDPYDYYNVDELIPVLKITERNFRPEDGKIVLKVNEDEYILTEDWDEDDGDYVRTYVGEKLNLKSNKLHDITVNYVDPAGNVQGTLKDYIVLDTILPEYTISYSTLDGDGDKKNDGEADGKYYYNDKVQLTFTITDTNFYPDGVTAASFYNKVDPSGSTDDAKGIDNYEAAKETAKGNSDAENAEKRIDITKVKGKKAVPFEKNENGAIWTLDTTSQDKNVYVARATYVLDKDEKVEEKLREKVKDILSVIQATDKAGNEADNEESVLMRIDDELPIITIGDGLSKADSLSSSAVRTFYGNEQEIVITVDDDSFNPATVTANLTAMSIDGKPIEKVSIKVGNNAKKTYEPVTVNDEVTTEININKELQKAQAWSQNSEKPNIHTASIVFSTDANYELSVDCVDHASNQNKDTPEAFYTVDTKKPGIQSISYERIEAGNVELYNGGQYVNVPVKVTVTVKDSVSGTDMITYQFDKNSNASDINKGIGSTVVEKIKNSDMSNVAAEDKKNNKGSEIETYSFIIPGLSLDKANQLNGRVTVSVADNANNIAKKQDGVLVIVDNIQPKFDIKYGGNFHEEDNVRYYDGNITATMTIDEANFDGTQVDYRINEIPQKVNWSRQNGDVYSYAQTLTADDDYVITVDYTDRSKNQMVGQKDVAVKNGNYTSQKMVIDTINPVVEINNSAAPVSQYDGVKYFNQNQTYTVTIKEHNFDPKKVKAVVTATDVNGGNVGVANYAAYLQDASHWSKNGDVYTAQLSFDVDAIYSLQVTCQDFALRESNVLAPIKFVVDKTDPAELSISYGAPVGERTIDGVAYSYYASPVRVTVTTDDNISGVTMFEYKFTSAAGVSGINQVITGVQMTEGNGQISFANGKRTASVQFDLPGATLNSSAQLNGTLEVTATNRSMLKTTKSDGRRIVVDGTKPVLNVEYSNEVHTYNDVLYYAGTITGRMTMDEANFFREDVQPKVAKDNGAAQTLNVNWSDQSVDRHIGSFELADEGIYEVTVDYTDRSGNVMDTHHSKRMVIDKVAPTISIEGIQNKTANNANKIGFTILAKDKNLDPDKVKVVVKKDYIDANGKPATDYVEATTSPSTETVDGEIVYKYVVENLPDDAIYSVSCTAEDKAGNTSSTLTQENEQTLETVEFSVNRKGSTFKIDEDTKKINGTFAKNPIDLLITEVNPNVIDPNKVVITLFKDDGSVVLLNGTDFEITEITEDGTAWHTYQYRIFKKNFESDGVYRISIYSEDEAGNIADNTTDDKNMEVAFVMDNSAPDIIVNMDTEKENVVYPVELLHIIAQIDDNMRLAEIVISLDGRELGRYDEKAIEGMMSRGEDYTIDIPESGNTEHTLIITATDKAGNVKTVTVSKFKVTTKWWIRFTNNKPLFYGSIAIAVILIFLIAFLTGRRRKNR